MQKKLQENYRRMKESPSLIRNERMDFFKGILILGVIWGHTIQNVCVEMNKFSPYWNIQTFDMPMFMIISGYFLGGSLNKKKFQEVLRDKISTLLFPALLWGVIIISRCQSLDAFSALYFLWVVLFCSLIVSAVVKLVRSSYFQIVLFAIITLSLNFIPLWLWNASYLFPFFCIGYLVNSMRINVSNWFRYGSIWAIIFVLLICFWKKDYTVWATSPFLSTIDVKGMLIFMYRYVIGIVGCGVFVVIFNILYSYYSKNSTPIYKFIVNCGKETLAIYILQDILLFKIVRNAVIIISKKLGYNPFLINENLFSYVIAPIMALLMAAIMMLMIRIVKNCKYTKYTFGGKFLK